MDPRPVAPYRRAMAVAARPLQVGQLLREWRARRNVSQLRLASRSAVSARHLSFISTVTTFGTAADVTLAELSVEAFYPADAETAAALS